MMTMAEVKIHLDRLFEVLKLFRYCEQAKKVHNIFLVKSRENPFYVDAKKYFLEDKGAETYGYRKSINSREQYFGRQ